jgi:hypothetical protein
VRTGWKACQAQKLALILKISKLQTIRIFKHWPQESNL